MVETTVHQHLKWVFTRDMPEGARDFGREFSRSGELAKRLEVDYDKAISHMLAIHTQDVRV